ncbi:glycerol-3-phosphate acyltransferase PlsX [Allocatelliglobosispora scoriae]|uniref:Phosphate acyltransferase n=1 Tax=Allocatelliglobosispora scoriae TaxID=643052 RepID=A0A841BYK8_9ACTN|nr:glycerol-3-phosphate acyltransferase PlsX [Allocatelliglobosispora scoriae]
MVDGVLRALNADPQLHLLLVGPPSVAATVLDALTEADRRRCRERTALKVVAMADAPLRAMRADTTIRSSLVALAAGEAAAVVSAGSSGATVTAAVLELGRLDGVRRPALAASIPAIADPVLLLDVGASVETNVATLSSHALLGADHARRLGLHKPRVGLLSVGREPGKGDRARRAAESALAELPIDFVGLVEGDDVCLGDRADVIVTDGFTGNVLLKGIEGAYALARGVSERSEGAPQGAPGGSVLARGVSERSEGAPQGAPENTAPAHSGLRRVGVPGGAPRAAMLLGVPGIVVVCHGAADADDLAAAIALAAVTVRARR